MRTITALFIILVLSGCLGSGETVLVDYSHGEIFMPLDARPMGYSKFNSLFEDAGYNVDILDTKASYSKLKKAKAYIIAGSMTDYTEEEVESIKKYVNQGGKVIILVHVYPMQKNLLDAFGIKLGGIVAEKDNLGRAQDFIARNITEHPITHGISEVSFYGAWGILNISRGNSLVSTSPEAWLDRNMNGVRDKGEVSGSFSLVQLVSYGKGEVLVISDDAPLINKFITEVDNKKLGENIVNWVRTS